MVLEIDAIRDCLPQRYPFLLVDRMIELKAGEVARAVKAVTVNEPCYRGLADGAPLEDFSYPNSMLVEALSQAAGLLLKESWPGLASRDNVVMFGAFSDIGVEGRALPGDVLDLEVRLDAITHDAAVLSGTVRCGDRTVLTAGRISAAIRPAHVLSGGRP